MTRTAFVVFGSLLSLGMPTGCSRSEAKAKQDLSAPLLGVGTPLPTLEGTDQNGTLHRLTESKGRPMVVYFYPKDNTPGCTKEACAFRDVWQRYAQAGIAIYGVSRDDRASHEHFAEQHHLPFPLIADTDGRWEKTFGVPEIPGHPGLSSRVSFLFDAQGKLARVYPNVDPGIHATQVLNDAEKTKG